MKKLLTRTRRKVLSYPKSFSMKILLLYFLTTTSLFQASEKNPKNLITLKLSDITIGQLFDQIELSTDYRFVYKVQDIDLTKKIDVDAKNQDIETLLTDVLATLQTSFTLNGKQIILKQDNKTNISISYSDNIEVQKSVSGTITNDLGNPFPGVYIVKKNTNDGTLSDLDGKYTINVSPQDTLVFSYLGYTTTSRIVGQQSTINVQMKQSTSELSEVIINGIFERKAESFTGSAVTFTKEELSRVGNQNIFQTIQNIDPSIAILDNFELGSNPNALPDMQIRGTSTFPGEGVDGFKGNYLKSPNQPLFILNGFEVTVERVFDLDFNRIKSLTILKDAASKSLYGSRAANGVVVIETDQLKNSETRITYNAMMDVELPDLSSYNLTNSLQKLEAEQLNGFYEARNVEDYIELQQLYNSRLKLAKEGLNTDWMALPLRNAIGQRHSLGVELGGQNLRVFANLNYQKKAGVMKDSYRENIGGGITTMYSIDNLKFRNITTVISNSAAESPYGTFNEYAIMNPYWRAKNIDGTMPYYAEFFDADNNYTNPLYNSTIGVKNESSYFNFINNFYLEWQLIPSLKTIARIGVDVKRNDADEFYPGQHTQFDNYVDDERKGSYQVNNGKSTFLTGNLNLQYSRNFGKHFVFGNASFDINERKYEELQHLAEGFPSSRLNNITFARAYALDSRPIGISGISRELGFLAVGSYVYDNRFLSDLTLRSSASSQFGADKRWSTFWSLGLGWNLHNESVFRKSVFEQLKVRGSLGSTGNQNFNTNQSIVTYAYYQDAFYQDFPGSYILNLGNPNLQWESKFDYNIGLDTKIGGLSLRFDYYENYTENLITDVSLPYSNGFDSVKENLGKVKNSGIDANATYLIWSNGTNFLNVNFGIATNTNKIVELSNAMRSFNESQEELAADEENNTPVLRYEDGMSMNAIWAVQSAGIDPASGREIFINKDGSTTYEWDATQMVVVGDNNPKYRGVVGISGEYERFGLSVTARYLGGGQLYNQTLVDKVENVDMNYNVDERVLTGRWQYQGQQSYFRGIRVFNYATNGYTFDRSLTKPTSRFVQDRNELDIAAISAYYDFGKSINKALGLERLRLGFNMNNVVKFSTIEIERGTLYPFSRTMSFSLTATF